MTKELGDSLNGFDMTSKAGKELARQRVQDRVEELHIRGLSAIADSTGVPFEELQRLKNEGLIQERYIPILYNHFYG